MSADLPPQSLTAARSSRLPFAFTMIEFLVAIGILGILIAILLPYLINLREMNRRTVCESRIRQIGLALRQYAQTNGAKFPLPETPYDAVNKPNGYVAFTGADDADPFAKNSAVQPNDITASLWLLIRCGLLRDPAIFICPGSGDTADTLTDARGNSVSAQLRGNFRKASNLSYSYASPFTSAFDFAFSSDRLPSEFVILADKNPGFECDGIRVVGPRSDAPPFELARGNSMNHQRAGQWVLHPAGDTWFSWTPYCGISHEGSNDHDNIYTALAPRRLEGQHPALDAPGYLSADIGAAYNYDSYLVPAER